MFDIFKVSSSTTTWSPDDIRDKAYAWTLEGDAKLLELMQNISLDVEHHVTKTTDSLHRLSLDVYRTNVALGNVTNKLAALQHSQFVENRVYEDDETLANLSEVPMSDQGETKTKYDPIETLTELLSNSMSVIERNYEKVTIDMEDSDEEDETPKSIIYRPKDPFEQKPLSFIIGSKEWSEKWHIGICDSDEEYSGEEKENDYSDSSESVSLSASLPSNAQTISESELSAWGMQRNVAGAHNKRQIDSYASSEEDISTASKELYDGNRFRKLNAQDSGRQAMPYHVAVPANESPSNQYYVHQPKQKTGGLFNESTDDSSDSELYNVKSNVGRTVPFPAVRRDNLISHVFNDEPPPDVDVGDKQTKPAIDLFCESEDEIVATQNPSNVYEIASNLRKKTVNLFDDDDFDSFMKELKGKAEVTSKPVKNLFDESSGDEDALDKDTIKKDVLNIQKRRNYPELREAKKISELAVPKARPVVESNTKTPENLFSEQNVDNEAKTKEQKPSAVLFKNLFDDEPPDDDFDSLFNDGDFLGRTKNKSTIVETLSSPEMNDVLSRHETKPQLKPLYSNLFDDESDTESSDLFSTVALKTSEQPDPCARISEQIDKPLINTVRDALEFKKTEKVVETQPERKVMKITTDIVRQPLSSIFNDDLDDEHPIISVNAETSAVFEGSTVGDSKSVEPDSTSNSILPDDFLVNDTRQAKPIFTNFFDENDEDDSTHIFGENTYVCSLIENTIQGADVVAQQCKEQDQNDLISRKSEAIDFNTKVPTDVVEKPVQGDMLSMINTPTMNTMQSSADLNGEREHPSENIFADNHSRDEDNIKESQRTPDVNVENKKVQSNKTVIPSSVPNNSERFPAILFDDAPPNDENLSCDASSIQTPVASGFDLSTVSSTKADVDLAASAFNYSLTFLHDIPPDDDFDATPQHGKKLHSIFYDDFSDTIIPSQIDSKPKSLSSFIFDEPPPDSFQDDSLSTIIIDDQVQSKPKSRVQATSTVAKQRLDSESKIASIIDRIVNEPGENCSHPKVKIQPKKLGTNFNINVSALLPGAKRPHSKVFETETHKKAGDIDKSNDVVDITADLVDVQLESDPLQSMNKTRAKIQVKRRPSTRKARQDNYRRSIVDTDDTVDGDSFADQNSEEIKVPIVEEPRTFPVEFKMPSNSSGQNNEKSNASSILFEDKPSSVIVPEPNKTIKPSLLFEEDHHEDNVTLFTTAPTKQIVGIAEINPGQATPSFNQQPAPIAPPTRNMSAAPLFDDCERNQTKADRLSSIVVKQPPESSTNNSIFGSDDDDDLFGSGISVKLETKVLGQSRLFDDDDENDDLFGRGDGFIATTSQSTTIKKAEIKKSTSQCISMNNSDFKDPLADLFRE